eukprot:CCRYP_012948-RA/>CCRYP_012948-RA protein AED:0.21 eAED:0.21 QI:450/1/1/1/0/0/2/121/1455
MTRSSDDFDQNSSADSHGFDGNSRSSTAEATSSVSESTTKRRKLSLSQKQRMHWRKLNENRAASRTTHAEKPPRDASQDAGGVPESYGALCPPAVSDSTGNSADVPLETLSSSDYTASSNITSNSTNNTSVGESATNDLMKSAVGTPSNAAVKHTEIIEIEDSDDENGGDTNTAPIKCNHFFPEQESMFKGNPQGQTPHKHELDYPYSYRSSAYVQHIAEACTLVMTDARWRTCKKPSCECRSMKPYRRSGCIGKTLISWEDGDDLSAVKAFASLYDGTERSRLNGSSSNKGSDKEGTKIDFEETDQQVFERAMYLYSRMFHRKGPWFDLTDLYTRYYAPKKKTQQSSECENDENDIVETCTSHEDTEPTGSLSSDKWSSATKLSKRKRQRFFTPKSRDNKQTSTTPKSSEKCQFTNEISFHQRSLEIFFTDIRRLLSMGLVRTFSSEYECGLVAGDVTTESKQRGTFLLAEERREVLRRLGGGQSPKAMANGDGNSRTRNEILVQMQKQKTVFSSYSPLDGSPTNTKDNRMLPVRKHVDHVLIRKFAFKIVLLASRVDKPRKSDIDNASRLIHDSWKSSLNNASIRSEDSSFSGGVICTLRLREAPLIALRRVMRLFLCASGGPGRMRDATNGWLNVPPASSSEEDLWHNVTYPGLSCRLGLASFELKRSYVGLSAEPEGNDALLDLSSSLPPLLRVFRHQSDFKLFEVGVDIRSFINTATESYEIERINRRRQLASAKQELVAKDSLLSGEALLSVHSVHDRFEILTVNGRRKFVKRILASCHHDTNEVDLIDVQASRTFKSIESDIMSLHDDKYDGDDGFANDTERMIVATSIVCHRVLQYRMINSGEELDLVCWRPWLRHLAFDSILVCVIWDCIPLLERNGRYATAISFLATILFGLTADDKSYDVCRLLEISRSDIKPYVQFLLPRRNRGKAFERLVIDITHVDRAIEKGKEKKSKTQKKSSSALGGDEMSPIQQLCHSILSVTSVDGSVPFSFLRSFARRLKTPLYITMKDLSNHEMNVLNIRLGNAADSSKQTNSAYSDWTPTVDYSVANSLSYGDGSTSGKRCSFVGWETDDCGARDALRSLTVEELALDEYFQGRLPVDGSLSSIEVKGGLLPVDGRLSSIEVKGGFVGWHCEGSHVRAIFRILFQDLLGQSSFDSDTGEDWTIFLTPYQTSPHDLHVGVQSSTIILNTTRDKSSVTPAVTPSRCFYERLRHKIETFLDEISRLGPQSICDILYDAVQQRWQRHENAHLVQKDKTLQKDMMDLRSLSCVAAGLGGAALASICRSLCFDYRHYSGGLPDLLLIRARYVADADSDVPSTLVDLGDWVGEAFAKENIERGRIVNGLNMLMDDEFLGCSKNGDGLIGSQRRDNSTGKVSLGESLASLPPRLLLSHNGKKVVVDTIFVEVKSANDRLDGRQEDWLNILDRTANARVCKFEKKLSKSTKKN